MFILSISYGWYCFFSITCVAILVIFLCWLIFKYYRFLLLSSFLGHNLPLRLINIAISALIFRNAVEVLIIKPFEIVFKIISILIDNIISVSKPDIIITSEHILNLPTSLYTGISNILRENFLQINIFLAIAFMGVLTLFINKVFYNESSQQYQLPTIKGTGPLQQNLFLFILMLFSLFLVLSAMIAIPVIENPKDFSSANPSRFDSLLSNIKNAKANAAVQYTLIKPDLSYMDTIKSRFLAIDSFPWKRKATYNILIAENELVETYFRNWHEFILTITDRHNKAIQDFEEIKNATFDDIQFKLKERSSRLSFGREQDYYLYLISWYSGALKRSIEFFKSQQQQIKMFGDDLRNKATDINLNFSKYKDEIYSIDTVLLNNSGLRYPVGYFNLNSALIPYDDISFYSYINSYFNVQQSD
ncbi:MAG TPA: hypothetical protein VK498_16015, partial [Ferruginibacter sp.]|nr:hypothetical protein [Ferruginibacter sp.]